MFDKDSPDSSQVKAQGGGIGRITACISRPGEEQGLVRHAFAIGDALAAPVTLFQVIEGDCDARCPDPLEWELRRQQARRALARLAIAPALGMHRAEIALAEGTPSTEIRRFAQEQGDMLLVVGLQSPDERWRGIGRTLHDLLYRSQAPIFVVPPDCAGNPAAVPRYRRLLVPVDGSSWAMNAVPIAARIAARTGAELLLAHVVPTPELTEAGPYDASDLQLRDQLLRRNARAARLHLRRLREELADSDVKVRTLCVEAEDVRRTLARLIRAEQADLVVLSPRGHGLSANADMPYGSVAAYLIQHCPAPLLLVGTCPTSLSRTPATPTESDLRLPLLAMA